MSIDARSAPEWLAAVLLAEDDTEESILGSDLHYEAIAEAHASLHDYVEAIGKDGEPAWYVSSQVTVGVMLPNELALAAKTGRIRRTWSFRARANVLRYAE